MTALLIILAGLLYLIVAIWRIFATFDRRPDPVKDLLMAAIGAGLLVGLLTVAATCEGPGC